ncbi:MAG: metallophosphoesterase family protein [Acidimicrobiia bacterium]|nr:metallophosphoesterase family protein [Acidimicrobiia bacterium]
MRLLVVADEAPPAGAAELVEGNRPDAVVTLGDLPADWMLELRELDVPRLGVHGNHDATGQLQRSGVEDMHLRVAEVCGWTFAGLEGCVRFSPGPHQYSQEQALELARLLPAAEVLLCHCPPAGVNDEPDDLAHTGFAGLREWVERHGPRYVLHGHTTPDPRNRILRLGDTEVRWIRGARVVELSDYERME